VADAVVGASVQAGISAEIASGKAYSALELQNDMTLRPARKVARGAQA
jgi:hypothetical protein